MKPYYADEQVTLWHGDSLAVLRDMPAASVDCCVTSPPYFGLRDYGTEGQYGLESSPAQYVETMRALFAEVRRVLADDGTLWLNLGDTYAGSGKGAWGSDEQREANRDRVKEAYVPLRDEIPMAGKVPDGLKPKDLMGVPWRVAFALQDDGWYLRNDIIWAKPNAMPNPVADRLGNRHEHLFMLAKRQTYWFDLDPIREPIRHPDKAGHTFGGNSPTAGRLRGASYTPPEGRNPGDVWTINTRPFAEAHFAVMPPQLAERAILAGCKPGGTVLDPFSGSGTTGLAANKHGRRYVGIDLNAGYLDLSLRTRFAQPGLDFGEPA